MPSQDRLSLPGTPRLGKVLLVLALSMSALAPRLAFAQDVITSRERVASDSPEAWAMNYFTATTFMTAFGETPALDAGRWDLALEFGEVPHLNAAQRDVGFGGSKQEDLNKSPVFGRARLALGLSAGWIAELGYTPPAAIEGVQAHDLFAVALARRWIEREHFSLSARVFGPHGSVRGDITCPEDVAGEPDPARNPYGCQAPSRDRIRLHYYGADLTPVWSQGAWRWHATLGIVRTEPEVQVDALTFGFRDRSLLLSRDVVRYLAVGVHRPLGERWLAGLELLHVPLDVRRVGQSDARQDSLTSLRLRVVYRPRGSGDGR